MNSEKIKCVIELGSTKVRCVIAQINDNSIINVLAYSTVQSKGIHNGVVVSPLEAAKVIRSCLSEAESKANIVLKLCWFKTFLDQKLQFAIDNQGFH